MADDPTVLEGKLEGRPLPGVLDRIASDRATGILTVQGEEDIVAVSFLDGRIVAADALNQTVEDGLGEVLIGQGLVEAEKFRNAARDHQGGSAGSLGDLLVQRGVLRRDQLLDALRMQTYRLMKQVVTWVDGEYRFYGGDEVSYEDGLDPLPIEELLIRALEDVGAETGLTGKAPRLEEVFRRTGARELRVGKPDEKDSGGVSVVTGEEKAILDRLGSDRSGADLARELSLGRYPTAWRLYRLLGKGLVERVAGAPAPAPRPAAPASAPAVSSRSGGDLLGDLSLEPPPTDLGAGVFRPPEPMEPAGIEAPVAAVERETFDEEPVEPEDASRWAARVLAVVAALLLFLGLVGRPASFQWPFPWQDSQRASYEHLLRETIYGKIDRAARTYFLTEAHYPDSLGQLVASGLLGESDLRDPEGHVLGYSAENVSYRIELLRDGQPVEGLGTAEAIAGDFLLDPQLIPPISSKAPLFLLD